MYIVRKYTHIPLFSHFPAHMRHRRWTPKIHKFNLVVHWDVNHRQGTNMWYIIIWYDIPLVTILNCFSPVLYLCSTAIYTRKRRRISIKYLEDTVDRSMYTISYYICVCVWSVRGKCDYVNSVICTTANNFEHDILNEIIYIYTWAPGYIARSVVNFFRDG